jgi:hypothetical protein
MSQKTQLSTRVSFDSGSVELVGYWRARQDSNLRPSLFVVIESAVPWTPVGPLRPSFMGFY